MLNEKEDQVNVQMKILASESKAREFLVSGKLLGPSVA